MKRSVFRSVVTLWILLCLHPFSVYAAKLVWYKSDTPPGYILSGPYQNKGYMDLKFNLFREEMKVYSHVVRVGNIKRIIVDIAKKNAVGESLLKKPEREKTIEFSVPHSVAFPHVIIIPKDRSEKLQPYLTADGTVMLEKLITESDLKLLIAIGRSYTGIIDEMLKKYPDHKNIITRGSSTKLLEGILKMILVSRGDYTIAYPQETYYHAKLMDKGGDFVSFPIEGMPKYVLVYAGVPKNEWGTKILNELNPVILKHRNTQKIREYEEAWMDENMKVLFRKYMDEAF